MQDHLCHCLAALEWRCWGDSKTRAGTFKENSVTRSRGYRCAYPRTPTSSLLRRIQPHPFPHVERPSHKLIDMDHDRPCCHISRSFVNAAHLWQGSSVAFVPDAHTPVGGLNTTVTLPCRSHPRAPPCHAQVLVTWLQHKIPTQTTSATRCTRKAAVFACVGGGEQALQLPSTN